MQFTLPPMLKTIIVGHVKLKSNKNIPYRIWTNEKRVPQPSPECCFMKEIIDDCGRLSLVDFKGQTLHTSLNLPRFEGLVAGSVHKVVDGWKKRQNST